MPQHEFEVDGMACGGCEENVENAVGDLDGVDHVEADHESGTVEAVAEDEDEVRTAITDAGYEILG